MALALAACGGGGGDTPFSSTNNPVPSLSSIDPASLAAGSGSFTLTVTGSSFISGSAVRWNGANRPTTFVSTTQINATIAASDIASPGTADVTVFNPAPGGGTSGSMTFTIENPVPAITSLSPSSTVAGSPSFTLTVTGTGFVSGSIVRWNGSDRTTTFVSATQVTAFIPSSDVAATGSAQVTVFNPAPGGGTSNAATFAVTDPQALTFTTSRLPATATGRNYDFNLAINGGVPPYTFTVTVGSLPSGVGIFSSGRLTGVVTASPAVYSFTLQVSDSAPSPNVISRDLSIEVRAALGRNEDCSGGPTTVTQISNGRLRASFSPYGDVDVYTFQGFQGQQVTIETFAQRLDENFDGVRDSFADTMLEVLDNTCPGPTLNGTSALAFNDDLSDPPNHVQDSRVTLTLPFDGTYYIRVREFRGDGRPDLIYDLSLSGAE